MGETPDDIREEIEETRARMGDTVEAIGYKADVKSRDEGRRRGEEGLLRRLDQRRQGRGRSARPTRLSRASAASSPTANR